MNFPEIFQTLLKERNLAPEEEALFLNPNYELLHDPLLLPDMARARDRVLEAIEKGEVITVYSDYDADGIPGAVVLKDFFTRVGYEKVFFYIPHRHDEGYGLHTEALDEIRKNETKLVITVDCGIGDVAEVAHATALGMEVIITDHHEPPEKLPEAYAIVNPKRKESTYPFKELCGSAVAYKLVQAMLAKESFGTKPGLEKWSLDMVGIATLSDMVPLVGENRILARFGLEVLRKSRRPGLLCLFRKLQLEQKYLTEDDVGFMITPRINAASRMGKPEDAFNLLSTQNELEAERLAEHLEKINQERKGIVASCVKAAKAELEKREHVPEVIVIGNPEWRPALLGLVANSLVEAYERPVFVWGRDAAGQNSSGGGILKGSCRSYNGYNLFKLMEGTKESFIEYGGHQGAGGFSITLKLLTTLEGKLSEALKKLSSTREVERNNVPISLHDIGEDLWRTVSQFAPFGTGNEKPIFKIHNAPIKSMKQFGKTKEHFELTLGSNVKAISFFSSPESFSLLPEASTCILYAYLEKSYFRNRPELRLRIVDVVSS